MGERFGVCFGMCFLFEGQSSLIFKHVCILYTVYDSFVKQIEDNNYITKKSAGSFGIFGHELLCFVLFSCFVPSSQALVHILLNAAG